MRFIWAAIILTSIYAIANIPTLDLDTWSQMLTNIIAGAFLLVGIDNYTKDNAR